MIPAATNTAGFEVVANRRGASLMPSLVLSLTIVVTTGISPVLPIT